MYGHSCMVTSFFQSPFMQYNLTNSLKNRPMLKSFFAVTTISVILCLIAYRIDASRIHEKHERKVITKNDISNDIVVVDEIASSGGEEGMGKCSCVGYTCGCCVHATVQRLHLDDNVCVNLTYLPNEYGISFTVSIGNHTVYNETISARNPPPICFGIPIIEKLADVCLRFYDLDVTLHKLHGCVELEFELKHIRIAHYQLGCFTIGNDTQLLNALNEEDANINVLVV